LVGTEPPLWVSQFDCALPIYTLSPQFGESTPVLSIALFTSRLWLEPPEVDSFVTDVRHMNAVDHIVVRAVQDDPLGGRPDREALQPPVVGTFQMQA
jgi:hypothetical protein